MAEHYQSMQSSLMKFCNDLFYFLNYIIIVIQVYLQPKFKSHLKSNVKTNCNLVIAKAHIYNANFEMYHEINGHTKIECLIMINPFMKSLYS